MPIVICEGVKIRIVGHPSKSKWAAATNTYFDAETGEEFDPESLPPEGRGHKYVIRKHIADVRGYYTITNDLRYWDGETAKVLQVCGAAPPNIAAPLIAAGRNLVEAACGPGEFDCNKVYLEPEYLDLFEQKAQERGWSVDHIAWCPKRHATLEQTAKLLYAGQVDPEKSGDREVLQTAVESAEQLLENPTDPAFIANTERYTVIETHLHNLKDALGLEITPKARLELTYDLLRSATSYKDSIQLQNNHVVINLPMGRVKIGLEECVYTSDAGTQTLHGTAKKKSRLSKIKKNGGDP